MAGTLQKRRVGYTSIIIMKRIIVGSDHAGLKLKNELAAFLKEKLFDVVDVGTYENKSCHYPDFAQKMAKMLQ